MTNDAKELFILSVRLLTYEGYPAKKICRRISYHDMKYVGSKAFRTLTLPDGFALSQYITAARDHPRLYKAGRSLALGEKTISIRRNAVT
jgi:hypothetical protein